jgi:hypothetical protein
MNGYNFEIELPPLAALSREGIIKSIIFHAKRQRMTAQVVSRGYRLCVEIDPASEKAVAYEAAIRDWLARNA